MVKVIITEMCRSMGRNQVWYRFKEKEINAPNILTARYMLKTYLDNGLYNIKRARQSIYVDTKSRGTVRTGLIYSGIEDTNYLQAWCSFYYTDEEETESY